MKEFILDGNSLTIEQVCQMAHASPPHPLLKIHQESLRKMKQSREIVLNIAEQDQSIYSINTGFGALSNKKIQKRDLAQLQYNLIRSHCAGVGEPFPRAVSRAILILRANCLISGFSGINPEIVELLLDFLNFDITPLIPTKGSVGASGDLAPLAHMALTLIGEGDVIYKGTRCPSATAIKDIGRTPAILGPKDGLALVNGTAVMTALASLAIEEGDRLAKLWDVACALTVEATRATSTAFHQNIHKAKPHPGQLKVAHNLRKLLANSPIGKSHKDCSKVQDPYSLRCAPQVHGACRQTLQHAREVASIEINSVTDNPLIFTKTQEHSQKILSGGNFHGQAIAMAMDYLTMGLAEFCSICERRVEKMMNPQFSELPPFLTPQSGLNSGMMIAHVTVAALASENKYLCHPASTDSIPTSTDKEDHVSMGVTAGIKLHQVLDNLKECLAIEFLCNTQALEFLAPLSPSPPLKSVYDLIRSHVPPLNEDRVLSGDIAKIKKLIEDGSIASACKPHLELQ